MSPQLHATFLGIAAVGAVAMGGVILARNPATTSVRVHFLYASALAWWFLSMAMIATADTSAETVLWSRLLFLSLGMLPGILYHQNIALAGLEHLYRKSIRAHWILSVALTLFAVSWPTFLATPSEFPWGYYPRFTGWGWLVVAAIVVSFAEGEIGLRRSLALNDGGSMRSRKVRWFLHGNLLTVWALIDFAPAFGLAVYPFGYVIITAMHALTVWGSLRGRLTELTPEFAAEHVLKEMHDGVLLVDRQGLVRLANRAVAETLGCDMEDLVERPLGAAGTNTQVLEVLRRVPDGPWTPEIAFVDRAGAQRYVRVAVSAITDQARVPVAHLYTLQSITAERLALQEKERLEAGIRHSQKLESLGVMASGIAHDFNNILLTILGNAELVAKHSDDAGSVRAHVQKIEAAAERASELTGQMLTYTGNAQIQQRPIDINQVVTEVTALMQVAVSKKATLALELHPDLPQVVGDPVQMSQVILNLITNASEALQGASGSIILRTGITRPDGSFQRWNGRDHAEPAAEYVILEAQDTGCGMDQNTLGKIFDPFFTTKFKGRGLGLATVLGIVRAHSGMTRVTSAPGQGTTFTIALPAAARTGAAVTAAPLAQSPWQGTGVALLADDEPEVRNVIRSMLAEAGFSVIEASDGREAVAVFQARSAEIDLVVMDRTMPGLDGREAFHRIREASDRVPVIFVSGYTDALSERLDPHTWVLHKPFRTATLTTAVREATLGD
jgi:signal transduction histidine kinase/CheY-like chemotaxis protein